MVVISSFDSEFSHKNHGQHDSSGGCSTHQHLFGGRGDHNSLQDNKDEGMLAKKRKVGEEALASVFHCIVTPQSLSIKLYLPKLAKAQMKPHGFQVIRQPPFVRQPSKVSLPSFIHRLVDYNVMDAAETQVSLVLSNPLIMAQTSNATMARNVLMPQNEKLKLLCKLKGSIHFEKVLTASSAYSDNLHGPSTLVSVVREPNALPSWFVQEHGDKFRKHVILRTEASTKPWSVTLTVFHKSPTVRQVKFAGGWKPFATFHGLIVGDSLIFSLTAVSEFEVYMFPGTGGPKKVLPSQLAPKKWLNDSGISRKKVKQAHECKSEKLPAEKSIEEAVNLNEWIAQKKTIEEKRATSALGHIPTSDLQNSFHSKDGNSKNRVNISSRGHHDSNLGQEPAFDQDELMVPSASGGRSSLSNEHQCPTIQKKLNEWAAQKKTIGEQRAVSAFGHNPSAASLRNSSYSKDLHLLESNVIDSSSRDHHDSNNGQEPSPTLDHDELMVQSGVTEDVAPQRTGGRKDNAGNEIQGFTLHRMPVNFPLSAGFLKQLTVSNFYRRDGAEGGGRTACMEIPVVFWRTYGSRLHSVVKLQGIREESQVRNVACLPILQGDQTWRLYLRTGWRDFAEASNLKVGQVLEFTLTADSFFVVRGANS